MPEETINYKEDSNLGNESESYSTIQAVQDNLQRDQQKRDFELRI